MFLKRKRSGLVKARGCANGRPQREYITKLESDIPAAFLSADWPEDELDCYIRFKGAMVEMLYQIKLEYWKFIRYTKMKNGRIRKVLVGKITKAIYGRLLGVFLFYRKLRGVLIDMEFQTNKFNGCTFNKMINGYQCTIQVHVDDLKLFHVQPDELNSIIDHRSSIN